MQATKVEKKHIAKKSTAEKGKRIGMAEIKMKAQYLGIDPGKMKKPELIHAIQASEGYSPCFGTSGGHCDYTDCCFIQDCLKS